MPEQATAVARAARQRGFDPKASAGLFVGISTFEDEHIQDVPYAVDDAVDLAYLFAVELELLRPGRVTLALTREPKKEASRGRLEQLRDAGADVLQAGYTKVLRAVSATARRSKHDGLLVLAVATHGLSNTVGDFLLSEDSLLSDVTEASLRLEWLLDKVANAPAHRRLVLLDACRERMTATRGTASTMAHSFAEAIGKASGQVVLSGATDGGYAYDDPERGNGVFTAAILDGLRGEAPGDARGLITVRSLADFLQERVAQWVRRHRPEDAGVSRGIGRRIEGAAESLPLAVNPGVSEAYEQYRQRREAARATLAGNLGTVLTGSLFDQIVELIPEDQPQHRVDVEELLEEIEALDGTERSQRSLRDYVGDKYGVLASGAQTVVPVEPVVSEPARSEASIPPRSSRSKESIWGRIGSWVGILVGLVLIGAWLADRWWPQGGEEPTAVDMEADRDDSGVQEEPNQTDTTARPGRPHGGAPTQSEESDPTRSSTLEAGAAKAGPYGMRFRYVPAGTYTVGSPADEPGRFDDREWLPHDVRLTRGFWIAETEVTQAQWLKLMPSNPSSFQNCGANCPVERVTWFDAITYANKLSAEQELELCYEGCTGAPDLESYSCENAERKAGSCSGYRLPTEAEWEIAARAGTTSARYAPELDEIAWHSGNSGFKTHPVGAKQANEWGLYDMLGNVWEWTGDRYSSEQPEDPRVDPRGPLDGPIRVYRGGSWFAHARLVRAACRDGYRPGFRSDNLGFRLSRGPQPAGAEPQE